MTLCPISATIGSMDILNVGIVLVTMMTPNLEQTIKRINMNLTDNQIRAYSYAIRKYSIGNNIDPLLVAAVIAAESSFKYDAKGTKGEIGLMQLRPQFHATYIPMEEREEYLYEADNNISIGAKYLAGLQTVFKPIYGDLRFVEHFNRGPNTKPLKFPYYQRVLQYYTIFGGSIERSKSLPSAKGKPREYRRIANS